MTCQCIDPVKNFGAYCQCQNVLKFTVDFAHEPTGYDLVKLQWHSSVIADLSSDTAIPTKYFSYDDAKTVTDPSTGTSTFQVTYKFVLCAGEDYSGTNSLTSILPTQTPAQFNISAQQTLHNFFTSSFYQFSTNGSSPTVHIDEYTLQSTLSALQTQSNYQFSTSAAQIGNLLLQQTSQESSQDLYDIWSQYANSAPKPTPTDPKPQDPSYLGNGEAGSAAGGAQAVGQPQDSYCILYECPGDPDESTPTTGPGNNMILLIVLASVIPLVVVIIAIVILCCLRKHHKLCFKNVSQKDKNQRKKHREVIGGKIEITTSHHAESSGRFTGPTHASYTNQNGQTVEATNKDYQGSPTPGTSSVSDDRSMTRISSAAPQIIGKQQNRGRLQAAPSRNASVPHSNPDNRSSRDDSHSRSASRPLVLGLTSSGADSSADARITNRQGSGSYSAFAPTSSADDRHASSANRLSAAGVPVQVSLQEGEEALPEGWVKLTNGSGKEYYHNEQSMKTSWKHPATLTEESNEDSSNSLGFGDIFK